MLLYLFGTVTFIATEIKKNIPNFILQVGCQRVRAALRAISTRRFLDRVAARTFPPLLPSSAAALRSGSFSSTSPVAIRMTWTALPITSAGRF
jgi:hypothetical protein